MKNFIRMGIIAFLTLLPSIVWSAELTNPLGTTDVRIVIGRLIQALLGVTGAIALLMFVWGGFQWLISGGTPEKVKKGKETLIWAIIGLAVILGAYMLISTLVIAFNSGIVQ